MIEVHPVCPVCRKQTSGEGDVLPSGAFVAKEACTSCIGGMAKYRETQVAGPQDAGVAGVAGKTNRWRKCSGPCKRVLPESQMNSLASRGKKTQPICGNCLTRSVMEN